MLVEEVAKLSAPFRLLLVRRYQAGRKLSELCSHEKVSELVIRQRINQAIGLLQSRMDARAGSRVLWIAPLVGSEEEAPSAPTHGCGLNKGLTVRQLLKILDYASRLLSLIA